MKGETLLPTEYHLEVYEDSFASKLISYHLHTSSPLPRLSVGDRFNHRGLDGWVNRPKDDEAFIVKEIEHIFWTIEESHIGYKMMVLLETVPHDWGS